MQQLKITVEEADERLDAYLARVQPEYSRSFWQKRCLEELVLVNGLPAKPKQHLNAGDIIETTLAEQPNFTNQTLPIIYEDDDVIVINKPTGMLSHAKGVESDEFTVAEFVRPYTTDGVDTNRPGIVHRLDRGTSGIMIAAKSPEAKRWIQKQFAERKVKKAYLALVDGHLKEPTARLDLPIERNPKKPQTFRVGVNGKPAETVYTTEQVFAKHTLLKLQPKTGRTHQLRVHLQYIGHPIVGDAFYGGSETSLGRLFLHAAELELTLPSRERKVFKAPMPTELHDYLKTLDKYV
jgi:23S rRNA pseudouridine1911/1915/1917 synthase